MSESPAVNPSPVPGTGPWVRKRKGSYDLLPPNMSEGPEGKLSRLKAELYQNMNLEDISKKFGLFQADLGRNMDLHVVRHRLEDLRSELNRKIQNQQKLKEHLESVMADMETFKQETNRMKDALDEQRQAIEDMKAELYEKQAQVNIAIHKNSRIAMISLFCLIATGVLLMFIFEGDFLFPLHVTEGITVFIICAALVLVGYILGYCRLT